MTPHAINKGWGVRLALLWGKVEDSVHCDRGEKKKKPLRLFSKEGQRERASLSTQDAAPLTWRPATVSLRFRCTFLKPKAPACIKYSCPSPSLNTSTSTFPSRLAQTLTADILHFAAAVRRLAARHKANCSTCLSLSLIRTKRGAGDRPAYRRIWSWKIIFRRHCSIYDGGYTFIGKLKKTTKKKQ